MVVPLASILKQFRGAQEPNFMDFGSRNMENLRICCRIVTQSLHWSCCIEHRAARPSEEPVLMIRATSSRSTRPNHTYNQLDSGKPPTPSGSGRGDSTSIASAKPSFFEVPKNRILDHFSSVLGPQNRPKTVPKRGPTRVPNPASFFDRFLSIFDGFSKPRTFQKRPEV